MDGGAILLIVGVVVVIVVASSVASSQPPDEGESEGPAGYEILGEASPRPAGDWVGFSMREKVAGVKHRKADVERWVGLVRRAEEAGRGYGVDLVPEPTNPHDPYAIKVVGRAEGRHIHVGYVPRSLAKEIHGELVERGLPVAVELYSIYRSFKGFVDINIIVLGPPGHSHSTRMRRAVREPA